jgi:hypothetical protein
MTSYLSLKKPPIFFVIVVLVDYKMKKPVRCLGHVCVPGPPTMVDVTKKLGL